MKNLIITTICNVDYNIIKDPKIHEKTHYISSPNDIDFKDDVYNLMDMYRIKNGIAEQVLTRNDLYGTNIYFVVRNPCIQCSIKNSPKLKKMTGNEYKVTLEVFSDFYGLINKAKKISGANVNIIKFEDCGNDVEYDFNKYLMRDEVEYFDTQKYLQLADLMRYLPQNTNLMKLFGYTELPVSKILNPNS